MKTIKQCPEIGSFTGKAKTIFIMIIIKYLIITSMSSLLIGGF